MSTVLIILLQTDADSNLKTVFQLPVDSDILSVILDYAYTDCASQLTAAGARLMSLLSSCTVYMMIAVTFVFHRLLLSLPIIFVLVSLIVLLRCQLQ